MKMAMMLLGALLAAPPAWADEAKIRSVVGAALGGARIDGVQPAPVPGLYEVRFQSREGMLPPASLGRSMPVGAPKPKAVA